mmetsp:Transcript_18891/g.60642  ORF Transcript_18891/g.60642 Transcript_18891/m.60642 type:complete len:477 (-) Transcript_18891:391-1821(-)
MRVATNSNTPCAARAARPLCRRGGEKIKCEWRASGAPRCSDPGGTAARSGADRSLISTRLRLALAFRRGRLLLGLGGDRLGLLVLVLRLGVVVQRAVLVEAARLGSAGRLAQLARLGPVRLVVGARERRLDCGRQVLPLLLVAERELEFDERVVVVLGERVLVEQRERRLDPVRAARLQRADERRPQRRHVRAAHLRLGGRGLRLHVRRALAQQALPLVRGREAAEEGGEPGLRRDAARREEARPRASEDALQRRERPLLLAHDPAADDVALRDGLGRAGHAVERGELRLRRVPHREPWRGGVHLLHEQRRHRAVDKVVAQPAVERLVRGRAAGGLLEEAVPHLEGARRDVVGRALGHRVAVERLAARPPELQQVEHAAQVAVAGDGNLLDGGQVGAVALAGRDLEEGSRDLAGGGLAEAQVEAVVGERLDLLGRAVVAAADHRQLGGLDERHELLHAAAVARRHAVHLVHDEREL